jgi:hypothetical protein
LQAFINTKEATDCKKDIDALVTASNNCEEDLLEEIEHFPCIDCSGGSQEERCPCYLNHSKGYEFEGLQDIKLAVIPRLAFCLLQLFKRLNPGER